MSTKTKEPKKSPAKKKPGTPAATPVNEAPEPVWVRLEELNTEQLVQITKAFRESGEYEKYLYRVADGQVDTGVRRRIDGEKVESLQDELPGCDPLKINFSTPPENFEWGEDHQCPNPADWPLVFPADCPSIAAKILLAYSGDQFFAGFDLDDPAGGTLQLPDLNVGGFDSEVLACDAGLVDLRTEVDKALGAVAKKNKELVRKALVRIDEYIALIKAIPTTRPILPMERAFHEPSQAVGRPLSVDSSTEPLSRMLPIAAIAPWSEQPRHRFAPEQLEELASSMRIHGFIPAFPLLVRPHPGGDPTTPAYQLVAGERRWRAAGMVEIKEVPCVVREMSDAEAHELSLLENLQREDLTALEEAEAYQGLLELIADGAPVHTVDTIAERIGKTARHVRYRLSLLSLRGTAAAKALESGELPFTQARLIASLPSARLREEVTERVLHNPTGSSPMPEKELAALLRDEYQRELKGARFDQGDGTLVPEQCDEAGSRVAGGKCKDCPHNSKNLVGEAERDSAKRHMCLNPECYEAKEVARYERWRESVTDAKKKICALPYDENQALWNPYGGPVRLAYSSKYIDLSDTPQRWNLPFKPDIEIPTWETLAAAACPVVMAEDPKGEIHRLALQELAALAAKQEHPELFKEKTENDEGDDEGDSGAAARLSDLEKRVNERIAMLTIRALIEGLLAAKQVPPAFWDELMGLYFIAVEYYDEGEADGMASDFGWRAPEIETEETNSRTFLLARIREVPERQKLVLLLEIMLRSIPSVSWSGRFADEFTKSTQALAVVLSVDLSKVADAARAEIEAEEKQLQARGELAKGLVWGKRHDDAEAFKWNEHTVCTNPDQCTIEFPGLAKSDFKTTVALGPKGGWHFGYAFTLKADGISAPVSHSGTAYSTRELALRSGLLELQEFLQEQMEQAIDEKHIARLEAYIELVEGGAL